jgi:hypothetical protein
MDASATLLPRKASILRGTPSYRIAECPFWLAGAITKLFRESGDQIAASGSVALPNWGRGESDGDTALRGPVKLLCPRVAAPSYFVFYREHPS